MNEFPFDDVLGNFEIQYTIQDKESLRYYFDQIQNRMNTLDLCMRNPDQRLETMINDAKQLQYLLIQFANECLVTQQKTVVPYQGIQNSVFEWVLGITNKWRAYKHNSFFRDMLEHSRCFRSFVDWLYDYLCKTVRSDADVVVIQQQIDNVFMPALKEFVNTIDFYMAI